MLGQERAWSVLIEAEFWSPESYDGEAEDRLMWAFEELGYQERAVAGGGPEGHIAVRLVVDAEQIRVAMDRGVAAFQDAVTKSGLEVGELSALEVTPVEMLHLRPVNEIATG